MSSENKSLLDSQGFFSRICEALGEHDSYGAQARIADKLGISRTAVGQWKEGQMPGRESLQNVALVAELSNTSLHWLLTGEGERSLEPKKPNVVAIFKEIIRDVVREEISARAADDDDIGGEVKPIKPISSRDIMLAPNKVVDVDEDLERKNSRRNKKTG